MGRVPRRVVPGGAKVGLAYALILRAIGFYVGNLAHAAVGSILAIGGVYLGFKHVRRGARATARIKSGGARSTKNFRKRNSMLCATG